MRVFRFPSAIRAIEFWLDGSTTLYAERCAVSAGVKKAVWRLNIAEMGYAIQDVKISLGPLFPAVPCELYVDAALCLVLPHIEEDGRVCLDEVCQPVDFDDPVAAVVRALKRFQFELLERSANEDWKQGQLQAERLSYWGRFCDQKQKAPRGRPRPNATFVCMDSVVDWVEGRIAAYIPLGTKHRRFDVQIVTLGLTDPVELARRHGWDSGTLVKGRAAFVRLPDDLEWIPSNWPKNFRDLDSLVV